MTSRIGEYVIATRKPVGAQLEHSAGSFGLVIHHHIEVRLLRPVGVRPPWRPMTRCQLECESGRSFVRRYNEPIITQVGHWQAQEIRIELSEHGWVWAVDDHMVKATNHAADLAIPRLT